MFGFGFLWRAPLSYLNIHVLSNKNNLRIRNHCLNNTMSLQKCSLRTHFPKFIKQILFAYFIDARAILLFPLSTSLKLGKRSFWKSLLRLFKMILIPKLQYWKSTAWYLNDHIVRNHFWIFAHCQIYLNGFTP